MSEENSCNMQPLEESQSEMIYDSDFYYRLAHPHYSPEENNNQRPSCQYENIQTFNLYDGSTALPNDSTQAMDPTLFESNEINSWWQRIGVNTLSLSTETQINTEKTCFGMPSLEFSQGCQFMPLAQSSSPSTTYVKTSMKSDKPKRARTAFTTAQLEYLERYFRDRPYVSPADRLALTMRLGVTDKVIKTWFQNRRFKAKNEMLEVIAACDQAPTLM